MHFNTLGAVLITWQGEDWQKGAWRGDSWQNGYLLHN